MATGTLFMIPVPIADGTHGAVIPPHAVQVLASLRYFLAEDVRTARRFISSLKIADSIEALNFNILNKDTPTSDLDSLLAPLLAGSDMGMLSESGCPGVADPGAAAAAYAHRKNIPVVPLVGPSSIILALMASGLNGQNFVFNGYLPVEAGAAAGVLAELERESRLKNRTQIFIETPYRNNSMLKNLVSVLHPDTRLCVALGITSGAEDIRTLAVREWKQRATALPKEPAIFLFLA